MSLFILGMHRSGASATTGVVNLLGVPLLGVRPASDGRDGQPHATDARPHRESSPFAALNDEILFMLGGSSTAPPLLSEGWVWDARLDPHRDIARRTVQEASVAGEWVCADPRNSILLPFWSDALSIRPVVIVIHRNPLEIAQSLRSASGIGKLLALALWERYLRSTLRNLGRMPVLVMRYRDLLSAPLESHDRIRSFLERHSIRSLDAPPAKRVESLIDATLRSVSLDGASLDASVTPAQRELLRVLEELCGEHRAFAPPELPDESETTEPLLAERRRADLAERRRRGEVEGLRAECSGLRARLEQGEADLQGAEQELRELRGTLATAEETVQALSAELLSEGRKSHGQRELIERLHLEVAKREDVIRSIMGSRSWRLRAKLRRLVFRGAD